MPEPLAWGLAESVALTVRVAVAAVVGGAGDEAVGAQGEAGG